MGRPRTVAPDQETELETCHAKMSFKMIRQCRKVGGGNFSEGLRAALAHAMEDIEWVTRTTEDNVAKQLSKKFKK